MTRFRLENSRLPEVTLQNERVIRGRELVFDVNWKALVGRSSGESYPLVP